MRICERFDGSDRAAAPLATGARSRRALGVAVAIFAMGAMVPAIMAAEELQHLAPLTFDIPSQPLASALHSYSTTTGMQLLYESSNSIGRVSAKVEGQFSRDTALRLLLADTDLTIRYTRANAITLAPASLDRDSPPASLFAKADLALDTLQVRPQAERSDSQLRAYTGVIQADIQQALRKDAKTRNGSYSAGIKLWIDGPRTVRRTELFRSSGDQDRDVVISRLLDGLQISQAPPANTPQPVMVMITVRSM